MENNDYLYDHDYFENDSTELSNNSKPDNIKNELDEYKNEQEKVIANYKRSRPFRKVIIGRIIND